MQRHLVRALAGAILLVMVPAPSPAAAESFPSLCPEMTDSITRLYRAYLAREPDTPGFDHWVSLYRTGAASLPQISEWFAQSGEFARRGLGTNEAFVDWVFADVVELEPEPTNRRYWIDALDGGYPRGAMMLTFVESQELVAKTGTAVPLAGFLRWYPAGTHWYCDIGSKTVPTQPLAGDVWADFVFINNGDVEDQFGLWTHETEGERSVTMAAGTLPAGFTNYNWDGEFTGDGDYGRFIEVQAGRSTAWTVVFYPIAIGPDRLGWQLT
jgi:hypothetical protein